MKEFFTDLIDNDTLVLIALVTLAVIQPDIREIVVVGMLGYWKGVAKK